MHPNLLDYDPRALRHTIFQKHGSDAGPTVFDSVVKRRQAQDLRYAELSTERSALQDRVSSIQADIARMDKAMRARLEDMMTQYCAVGSEAVAAIDKVRAELAPLLARNLAIQQEMRAIVEPRVTERELLAAGPMAFTPEAQPPKR